MASAPCPSRDTVPPLPADSVCCCCRVFIRCGLRWLASVVARDAVPQAQELPQERCLELAKQRHVRTVLGPDQDGEERDQQQLMQVMAGIILPRVDNLGEAGDELFRCGASTLKPAFRVQPQLDRQRSPSTVICGSSILALGLRRVPRPVSLMPNQTGDPARKVSAPRRRSHMNNRIRASLVALALMAVPLLLGMAAPVQAQVMVGGAPMYDNKDIIVTA